jgi:hypothetical protein
MGRRNVAFLRADDRHAMADPSLAAAGKFFEGYVVFMTGVALPLFSREFNIVPVGVSHDKARACLLRRGSITTTFAAVGELLPVVVFDNVSSADVLD